ncbi:MAG TPA: cytochrome-c peroxidase [Bacteroidetes bacterium]|nr:cytochrome-c peroxidase [Bacteroidota bacterium]
MKHKLLITSACLLLLFSACKQDETGQLEQHDDLSIALNEAFGTLGASALMLPGTNELSKIPQDPKNRLTKEKVTLGALLYHETGLALNPKHAENSGNYSCASCHFASAGFQAGRHQAISDGGMGFGINGEGRMPNPMYDPMELDVQPIRTPTTLNSAYQNLMLWNGQFGATGMNTGTEALWTPGTPIEANKLGYEGVETQAIAALNVHRMKVGENIFAGLGYSNLFDAAFPEVPETERYDREHAGLAIAAYERSLIANEAPFQQWMRGNENAMTKDEKWGAALFFGKAKCATCHNGPNLGNMEFRAIGMKDLYETPEETFQASAESSANLGRYSFTNVEADKYKFKVPQLYNLADSPFYGHGASFRSIRDIIVYKNNGVKENANVPDSYLDEAFQPLGLTDEEIDQITAFIEHGLRDPNLIRYQPLSVRSGNCFPNNDEQSKADLGCD